MNTRIHSYKGKNRTLRELVDIAGRNITQEAMAVRIRKHGVDIAMSDEVEWQGSMNLDFSPFDEDRELKQRIKNWLAVGMPVEEMMIKARVCR